MIDSLTEPGAPSEYSRCQPRERELLIASRQFAVEKRLVSWWQLCSTLLALGIFAGAAGLSDIVVLKAFASLLTGLTLVRMFILYHDYQHDTILKGSWLAGTVLCTYGHLMLTPPSVWRRTHNHHHRNNSKLFGSSIGTFPIMTTECYRNATWLARLEYRIARSSLVIVCGYVTVFLLGMSMRPLWTNPRQHLDACLSLALHFGAIAGGVWWLGWSTTLFVFILPTWIAMLAGTYLFYVQHNFPGAKFRRNEEWTYTQAALTSSSYLEMGPVMDWLTGNIGYHHVHHLNAKIPFYRLPEAMAALVPLQSPARTSLRIRDIVSCLQLKLWDTAQDRFVTFGEAELSKGV